MVDIYQYVLTLLFVILFVSARNKWFFYPAALAIAVVACLIHHTFCCLFFPFFVACFIYHAFESDAPHLGRAIAGATICLCLLLLLGAIWFGSTMNVSVDALYDEVMSRTHGVAIRDRMVWHWLYDSDKNNRVAGIALLSELRLRHIQWFPTALLISPIIALFVAPWVMAIRKAESKAERWKFRLILILPNVVFMPIFVMATDYGRWWLAWFFCQMVLLMVMVIVGDRTLCQQLIRLKRLALRYWYATLLGIVYISSLGWDLGSGNHFVSTITSHLLP